MSNGTITMTGAEYDALAGKIATLEAELAKLRAGQETDEYPPCDYCGVVTDYHPWHGSGLINGRESPHIHACNECRHLLPSTPQPSAVPDGWRELLQEVAEYAPPYGTIVAMTSQMALGSKARRMLAAAPSAPATVQGVNQQLLEALEKVDSEHEILGWMKACELRRGRGSFGIAVMSDPPALEWQALDKELQKLIDARHAALAEVSEVNSR